MTNAGTSSGSRAARRITRSAPAIAYRDNGSDGEPVVFIHGVGSSASTWDELFARLGDRYRLIAADLRGHGSSAVVPGPCQLDDLVADHVRLLDDLGLRSAHVVGFSLGALIGQAIALAHPDRTRSLVLLNGIGDRTDAERARAQERLAVIASTPPPDVAAASASRWFTAAFTREQPGLVSAEVAIVAATDHDSYAAAYRVLADSDLIGQVAGITCPLLIVTGENDAGSTPRMSAAIHQRVPGSRLVIVPDLQHYLHIEAAGMIAGLVTDFLDEQQPAPVAG